MRMSISVSVKGRWGREDGKRMASRLVQNAIPTALVSQRHVKQSEMERQGTWLGEILKRLRIEAHVRPTLLRPSSGESVAAGGPGSCNDALGAVDGVDQGIDLGAVQRVCPGQQHVGERGCDDSVLGSQTGRGTDRREHFCVLQIANMPKTLSLRDVAAGMRSLSAALIETQALPFAEADLQKVLFSTILPVHARVALYLAFKTAIRWDEVSHLTSNNFQFMDPHRLLVDFRTETKASQKNPYRPDMRVILQDDQGIPSFVLRHLLGLQGPLSQWSTTRLDKELKAIRPSRQWLTQHPHCLRTYSGHSAKRTAAELLLQQAVRGKTTVQQVQQVLKHLSLTDTVRYVNDPTLIPLALGSHEVTRLLTATHSA